TGVPTLHDSGKHRRPRLFVMVLKYSGRAFRKVVWKSSKETWCRLHEEPNIANRIREGKVDAVACVSCNKCFAAAANYMPVYCYNKGFPK
ncbi:MAG: hypothetical protein LJE96_14950, partial [Deltaproteobacteria bacterium]|nr:hypothetical protein [Deltaproteobacteria bacterium]